MTPITSLREGAEEPSSFQQRVEPWRLACFGPEISGDTVERNHRFLEEALELVQACGCTASEAHQLVDYTFNRPVGEKAQEAGGVMVTLAALCRAQGIDMHEQGEVELARIWTMVEKIRAKQAAKPKHSPLPEAPTGHFCPDSPGICECFPRASHPEYRSSGEREPLTQDEIAFVLNELHSQGHGHGSSLDDFEPECPSCTAADKLKAALAAGVAEVDRG